MESAVSDVANDPDAWFDEFIQTMSSDEEVEEDMPEELMSKELALYYQEVDESDGFEIGDHRQLSEEIPGLMVLYYYPPDKPVDDTSHARLTAIAQLAIDYYNNHQNASYGNVEVLRANVEPAQGLFYYITFKATSMLDESTETFQSKVYVNIPPNPKEVIFVRIKPTN